MFTIIGPFFLVTVLATIYSKHLIFKYKNPKDGTDKFFSSYDKKYGTKHRAFDKKKKKMQDIKIGGDIFLGYDLSYEKKLKIVKCLFIF